ncbi:MAG TPA: histidine kinase dimerization/phospho-acceptor domain-containing protein, partial [Nitrospiria bacterium]|nr:histidine kinase dimerization/phospho-acceptor domain-containing protein [Nitrospiria bacterium]
YLFERYKEIWVSLIVILSFLFAEYFAKRTILRQHLLSSGRFYLLEDYMLEIVVILLILGGGVFSNLTRMRRQRAEVKIMKDILVTLNQEMSNPLTVILGNISLLLKSENRLAAENRSVIHQIETASHKIGDLIVELSRMEQVELLSPSEADRTWRTPVSVLKKVPPGG